MTVSQQLASTPLPTDLPFYNYGGSDIGPNLALVLDTTNVVGTAGDGVGVAIPAIAGSPPLGVGVSMQTIKAGGSAGQVRTVGIVQCIAFAAITAGTIVDVCATSGSLGFVQAHTANKPQLGIALSTSGANGDAILVLLMPANNG